MPVDTQKLVDSWEKIMEIVKTQIELSCKNILNAKNYDFNQQMVF